MCGFFDSLSIFKYLNTYNQHNWNTNYYMFDTNSYIYSEGALVGVRLMVLDEDLAEARKALRSYKP